MLQQRACAAGESARPSSAACAPRLCLTAPAPFPVLPRPPLAAPPAAVHRIWPLAHAAHDVYLVHENKVQHWSSVTQRLTTVMDVSGGVTGAVAPGIGQVQLCTLCAR